MIRVPRVPVGCGVRGIRIMSNWRIDAIVSYILLRYASRGQQCLTCLCHSMKTVVIVLLLLLLLLLNRNPLCAIIGSPTLCNTNFTQKQNYNITTLHYSNRIYSTYPPCRRHTWQLINRKSTPDSLLQTNSLVQVSDVADGIGY